MLVLPSLVRPPNIYLLAGCILLFLATVSVFSGRISGRFRWVYRSKDAFIFWILVAVYCLAGACFVGVFFFNVYAQSN
jgi:hypothetical protein